MSGQKSKILVNYAAPARRTHTECETARGSAGIINMKNAWAIRIATDEVLITSAQLGVKDIIFYGGPGSALLPGTNEPHGKGRNTYDDYAALR